MGLINAIGSYFSKITGGWEFGTQLHRFKFKGNVEMEGSASPTPKTHSFQDKDGTIAHLDDIPSIDGLATEIYVDNAIALIATDESGLLAHLADTNNPHGVTKAQVGLGNVDNTSDLDKPVSTAQATADNAILTSANSYSDGLITQLINGAPADANTLKELNDKILAVQAIIGSSSADGDTVVNTVSELLAVFATFPEGVDLVTLLAGKVNVTDIYNALDCIISGKVLDARQGKVLNDAITAINVSLALKANNSEVVHLLGAETITGLKTFSGALTAGSFVKSGGTASQFLKADGSVDSNTYLTSISGITAGGELSGTYPNPTLLNSAVIGKVLTGVNITGGSVSATDSILTAFGKLQNQINALIGGTIYQSTWNASTNSPALTTSVGTKGYYYIVSVAGATNLNGITDWKVGDWAIYDGASWQKVDNTDAVSSVNGFTGAVSLTTSNISEVTNLYYTDARSRNAISLTTTGNSGASTYSSATGIFNIPTYTLVGLGGQPLDADLTAIAALSGTSGFLKKTAADTWALDTNAYTTNLGTVTSVSMTVPTGLSISGSPITTSGTLGLTFTAGYSIPTDANQTNWTTAYTNRITSLTTTGSSGAATLVSNVLNIPTYTLAGLGGQPLLTNPIIGTGTTNYLPKFTGTSALGNSLIYDNGTSLGIGTTTLTEKFTVTDSGAGSLFRLNNTAASWASTMIYGTTTATTGGFDFIGMYANGVAKFNVSGTGAAIFASTVTAPTFIGSLTGNASSATNVAWSGITSKPTTLSGYGITDGIKTSGTLTGNIDTDYGEGIVTFDPVPTGTPPLSSANIRTLNIGNNFARRTQLAFEYSSDRAFLRRRSDAGWNGWVEFITSSNIGSQSVNYATSAGSATSASNLSGSINAGSGISTMKVNDTRYWVNDPNAPGNYFQALTLGNGSDFSQIGVNSNNQIYFRFNGTGSTWFNVLSSNNYNSYAPTLTGTGASGTWGINVTGNASTASNLGNGGGITSASGSRFITIDSTDGWSFLRLQKSGTTIWDIGQNNGGNLEFRSAGAASTVTITSTGTLTATGDVVAYSDKRVKENISTITNALSKVKLLRGVSYNRIDSEDKSEKLGVIAQEIQEVLPQVVHEQKDGMLGVSYGNISAVLIEAIKEQQEQIEELKSLVKALTANS